MARRRIAIVTSDQAVRMAAARAFDAAPRAWSVRLFDAAPDDADVVVLGPDACGDGIRFDPARPEAALEEVRRALDRPAGAVAVTGVSGGAGTTTLSLHLAALLGVPLVDLSPEGAAARRLGIEEFRAFAPGDDVREASLPVAPGFRLLLAPGEPGAVAAACGEFGRAVVDGGRGLVEQGAAHVLVLPPSLPAARRARSLLLDLAGDPCAVVVNRTGPGGSASRVALERALARRITLLLPCTPALRDAEDEGRLLTSPLHRWVRGVRRLARALEGP